jgi:DNA-binding transcriptional ArsR family regulator
MVAYLGLTRKLSKDSLRSAMAETVARTIDLTDPRALRAVAHPTRLALVGLLRREGPLTATQAGVLVRESPASCSFHLRQLAKYGLVEEAGGGTGRERPWKATALFTRWPNVAASPEQALAAQLLSSVVAERYFERVLEWLERKPGEPPEWQKAAQFGDTILYLTAGELADLGRDVAALVERYVDRTADRALRPKTVRPVTFLHLAFPAADDGSTHGG